MIPGSLRTTAAILPLSVIGGISALLCHNQYGPAVGVDSVWYLLAGQQLLEGRGLTLPDFTGANQWIPLTQWPPLYPMVLAALGLSGMELKAAGQLLNAGLFSGNILLVGLLVRRYSGSLPAAVIAAFFMAISRDMLVLHQVLATEPLFYMLSLGGLCLLERHLRSGSWQTVVAAAVVVGLACIDRYFGVVLIATGVVCILFLARARLPRRLADAAVFGVVAVGPLALFLIRNRLVSVNPTNRQFRFLPQPPRFYRAFADTWLDWFWVSPSELTRVHSRADQGLAILMVCGLAGLAVALVRARRLNAPRLSQWPNGDSPSPAVFAIFAIGYLVMFFLIATFVEANITDLEVVRLLSPLFICAVVLVGSALGRWCRGPGNTVLMRVSTGLIVAGLGVSYLGQADAAWRSPSFRDQRTLTNAWWDQSALIRYLRELPPSTVCYSNRPEVFYGLMDRPALYIPHPAPVRRDQVTRNRGSDVGAMIEALSRNPGLVIYFYNWPQPLTEDELVELIRLVPLEIVDSFILGEVYRFEGREGQ